MSNFFNLLSGGVPGGTVLLFTAIIFVNLAFFFFKKSGLFGKDKTVKKIILINFFVVALYLILWMYKRPVPLPERIVVLPSPTANTVNIDARTFLLADIFKQNNYSIDGRYLVHCWDWLLATLKEKKYHDYNEWLALGQKLNPHILIESNWQKDNILLVKATITNDKNSLVEHQIHNNTIEKDMDALFKKLDLDLKKNKSISVRETKYLEADLKIETGKLGQVLAEFKGDSSVFSQITRGKAFAYKGFQFKYNYEKMEFVEIVNPDFENAKANLYPVLKSGYDVPEVTYLLGRIAIREQDYESAEVFMKKTFTEELWNPRIYYYLSFLLSSRLEELGYNRRKVLEKAVELDPGFTDAVVDLANEAYIAGSGAVEGFGTQYALNLLEEYLNLNSDDPDVLSLLATYYIKTEKLDKAEAIYQRLIEKYPHESNFVYDMGIVSYIRTDYQEALSQFKKAIAIDNNLDAYLYAGITLQVMGRKREALKYYQDRVRYKTSDDDEYAKEAMQGIRDILEDLQNAAKDSLN